MQMDLSEKFSMELHKIKMPPKTQDNITFPVGFGADLAPAL